MLHIPKDLTENTRENRRDTEERDIISSRSISRGKNYNSIVYLKDFFLILFFKIFLKKNIDKIQVSPI